LSSAASVLVLCVALGACGKSSPHSGGAAATKSAPAPAARKRPLTRARALAFARAVNLTSQDVPGFSSAPRDERETPAERRLAVQLRRCAGATGSAGGLAEVRSPSFRVRRDVLDLDVSSEVSVAPSGALALRELTAIRSARVRTCFSRYLDSFLHGLRPGGAELRPVSIATGTPPAPGASGSFAWRITAPFGVRGTTLSLYVDILGFVLGPARVTLVSSGVVRPFPAVIQQRLFTLLLARASGASL
jgi:hypothetical protein